MFHWLVAPSKSFAEGMEIAFSVGLFLTTLMVVVGLIGEYREGDWWKRKIHIFEILVVLGVAGEMVTETGAFWYSLRLQSIEETAITAAQKTADDSRLAAGRLGVTVDNFQGFVVQKENEADAQFNKLKSYVEAENEKDTALIAQLDKDKDTLDKARDDAAASEASAKKVLADMTSELEAQRQVREKMLAVMAARELSNAQIANVAKAVTQFGGQSFTVTTYWDSKEPLGLANKIATALIAAKWQYDNEGSKGMMLGGIEGVQVYVHPEASSNAKSAADVLVAALNAEGISTVLRQQNSPGHPNEKLYINVGAKP
jgi:hypothetical protein